MKVGKFYEYSLFGIRCFFATVVYETACIISLLRDAVKNLFEVRIYLRFNPRIIILQSYILLRSFIPTLNIYTISKQIIRK